jgi:hypothetical protein
MKRLEESMEPVLTTILAALAAGAAAKAKDVASQAILDAYNGLKALIVRKLDGDETGVSVVEKKPESENAHAVLAESLTEKHLQSDGELQEGAQQLTKALIEAKAAGVPGMGDIDIHLIQGKVNATVENLGASGRITIGTVIAQEGDARVSGLHAGTTKN